MPNTVKKFCNLGTYIEQRAPEFYEMIYKKLCLGGLLKPQRDRGGYFTFLFPNADYIKAFIKAGTSSEPEKAADMLLALIIDDRMDSLGSFSDFFVNRAGRRIEIKDAGDKEVNLRSGHTIKESSSHLFIHWHPNPKAQQRVFVYDLEGKGELTGSKVTTSDAFTDVDATGGYSHGGAKSSTDINFKAAVLQKLENLFRESFDANDTTNVYMQKVYFHLRVIQEHAPNLIEEQTILDYLGNEEVSDSYLLDHITPRVVWEELYKCFECDHANLPEPFGKVTAAQYHKKKQEVLEAARPRTRKMTAAQQKKLLGSVRNAVDIRRVLTSVYGEDKFAFGRDTFIVFTNVCKDMWQRDGLETYECYRTIVRDLKRKLDKFHEQPNSSVEFIMTVYGNLLKSDVLCFAAGQPIEEGYDLLDEIPDPISWKLFSLNHIQQSAKPTRGGCMYGGYANQYL